MHLLLDENISQRIAPELEAAGIDADYAHRLDLGGAADPLVFEIALERGFDAIVTQDRYRRLSDHVASLRAMRAGLRIVRLVFTESAGVGPSPSRQLRLILAHRGAIEAAVASDSPSRLLVLYEDPRRPIRIQRIEDIEAEWRERGSGGA